jgi:hypothetical protein
LVKQGKQMEILVVLLILLLTARAFGERAVRLGHRTGHLCQS